VKLLDNGVFINMELEILTPKGLEFKGEASKIILPTKNGQITILPNHEPLISVLAQGVMQITAQNNIIKKEIEGGIIEVCANTAVILLKNF